MLFYYKNFLQLIESVKVGGKAVDILKPNLYDTFRVRLSIHYKMTNCFQVNKNPFFNLFLQLC